MRRLAPPRLIITKQAHDQHTSFQTPRRRHTYSHHTHLHQPSLPYMRTRPLNPSTRAIKRFSRAHYKRGSPNYRPYRLCGPMLQPTKRFHTSTRLFSTSTTFPRAISLSCTTNGYCMTGILKNSSRMSDGARTECGSWGWPLKRMNGQRAGKSRKEGCKGC